MKSKFDKMQEAMQREGDPSDQTINAVEEHIIWPKMVEFRNNNKTCLEERNAWESCQKKFGIMLSIACLYDKVFYTHCLSKMRKSDDIMDDCMEEYLALRSRYRLTKDPAYLDRMMHMVYSNPPKIESKSS